MQRALANPERPFVPKSDLPVNHGKGRRCLHPGCITVLNQWHDGDRCYLHEERPKFVMLDSAGHLRELMREPS